MIQYPKDGNEQHLQREKHEKWINNGYKRTKILVNDPIPEGWYLGRTLEVLNHDYPN